MVENIARNEKNNCSSLISPFPKMFLKASFPLFFFYKAELGNKGFKSIRHVDYSCSTRIFLKSPATFLSAHNDFRIDCKMRLLGFFENSVD